MQITESPLPGIRQSDATSFKTWFSLQPRQGTPLAIEEIRRRFPILWLKGPLALLRLG